MEHVVCELSHYAHITLIAPKGSQECCPASVATQEISLHPLMGFFKEALFAAAGIARSKQFDLVLGGSGLVAPLLWLTSKYRKVPTACFIHGLDLIVESRLYQFCFLPAIRRMDLLLVNSEATRRIALAKGVPASRCVVLNPGVEVDGVSDSAETIQAFKVERNLSGRRIILSVGRLVKRKGLHQFISNILPELVRQNPDVLLVVVGAEPSASLIQERGYLKLLESIVAEQQLEQHVRFAGEVSDVDLRLLYQISRVLVFPLQEVKGDVEGFGMVAVEAASFGVPTVAFNVGGVGDAVSHGRSGYLVEAGNNQDFFTCVSKILKSDELFHSLSATAREFASRFSWSKVGKRLQSVLAEFVLAK